MTSNSSSQQMKQKAAKTKTYTTDSADNLVNTGSLDDLGDTNYLNESEMVLNSAV